MGSSLTKNQIDQINNQVQKIMQDVWTTNSATIRNYIENVSKLKVSIGGNVDCKNLNIENAIRNDMRFMDSFSTSTANDLKAKLTSDLENKTSQSIKILKDFLAGIGVADTQENITKIVNRVEQIIDTKVTTQNMNNILRSAINITESEIKINGDLKGENCRIANNIQSNLVAETFTNNLTQTLVDDAALSRIVNDSKQTTQVTSLGILALAIAAAIVIIALGYFAGKSSSVIIKIILVLFILAIIYVVIAYFANIWPWPKRGNWGCAKNSTTGFNTGGCKLYAKDDPATATYQGTFYKTEAQCQKAIQENSACGQYWGCSKDATSGLFNGGCQEYDNALTGPYYTRNACEDKVRGKQACQVSWDCKRDITTGFNAYPPACQGKNLEIGITSSQQQTEQQCQADIFKCRQYWIFNNNQKKCQQIDSEPVITQELFDNLQACLAKHP